MPSEKRIIDVEFEVIHDPRPRYRSYSIIDGLKRAWPKIAIILAIGILGLLSALRH